MAISPFTELPSHDPPRQIRFRFNNREFSIVNLLIPPLDVDGSRKMNYVDKDGNAVNWVDWKWQKHNPYTWELAEWNGEEYEPIGHFISPDGAKQALKRRKGKAKFTYNG